VSEGDEPFRVDEMLPGTQWLVRGVLGRGGMGVVLDVVRQPGIRAAVKVLLPRYAGRSEVVERFLQEVKVLATLEHPNIVRVQDWGRLPDGSPYFVMERLHGSTLRMVAKRRAISGRPISARQIHRVALQVCEGSRCAHTNDPPVVHRDLKPDNVFIHTPPFGEETVKLIDFGVAELLEPAGPASSRDAVIGTPRYMSPEALRGEAVGPKADLYAVALVVYELLTLRFPWDVDLSKMSELLDAHTRRAPLPPSTFSTWVPKSVDECLLQALSKHPEERQDNVGVFSRGLYELQFADDGTLLSDDVNTTVPSLGTLAQLAKDAQRDGSGESIDTEKTANLENLDPADRPAMAVYAGGPETRKERPSAPPVPSTVTASAPLAAGTPTEALGATGEGGSELAREEPESPAAPSIEGVSAERIATPRRRRWLLRGVAAGLALALALGAGLRAKTLTARHEQKHASAMGTSTALTRGSMLAPTAVPTMSTLAEGAAREALSRVLAENAVDAGAAEAQLVRAVGVDLDAPRPNLGVAPLPSERAVAQAMAASAMTPAPGSGSPEGPAPKAAPKAKAATRAPARDDGLELITVPR